MTALTAAMALTVTYGSPTTLTTAHEPLTSLMNAQELPKVLDDHVRATNGPDDRFESSINPDNYLGV